MGAELPAIEPHRFAERLSACSPAPLAERAVHALIAHYEALRRWNPRLGLVGPQSAADVVERHYGESLAGLPLLPPEARTVVDLGSGGGFPGFVLAAATDRRLVLCEAHQRKAAFLAHAGRRAGVDCRLIDRRIEPESAVSEVGPFELLTVRAVALGPDLMRRWWRHHPRLRLMWWSGSTPSWLDREARIDHEIALSGSERRRILLLRAPPRSRSA